MTGAARIGPPAALVRRPCAIPLLRRTLSPHNDCADQRGVCRIDQLLFPLPLTSCSSKAGAAAAEREAGQIVDHPHSSAARSMRLQGLSTAGVRRRDGGAIDTLRTDSHDPRIHEEAAPRGRLFIRASFLLDRARPVFFSVRRKENGGCIPREPPGPHPPRRSGEKDRPLRDGPARTERSSPQSRDTAVPLTVTISIPLSAPSTS